VFKVNTDGTGFAVLHGFAGGATDGANAFGPTILSGTTLYGMTTGGGASSTGTVFKVETDGTGFALLHSFAGGATDGKYPMEALVLSGAVLYGLTNAGGTSNLGVAFKINTDGTGFALLHSFTGGVTEGNSPLGSPTLVGSTLYGMTNAGGASDKGTVFKMNTDGSSYALVRSFAGGTTDGANPQGDLVPSGSSFYGMTSSAGSAANAGTVFRLTIACGANEHVTANVCLACAAGTTHTAGDDPAGADTACAVPVLDAGADASDASVPTPDASMPAVDASVPTPTPDASVPTPDGGTTPGSNDTSGSDGGCTMSSSRSNSASSVGLAAFAALAIAGLRRRRRANRIATS
jgi:MYXO-CTERM domain-containing protein